MHAYERHAQIHKQQQRQHAQICKTISYKFLGLLPYVLNINDSNFTLKVYRHTVIILHPTHKTLYSKTESGFRKQ